MSRNFYQIYISRAKLRVVDTLVPKDWIVKIKAAVSGNVHIGVIHQKIDFNAKIPNLCKARILMLTWDYF